ncbi:MAG: GDP-mannose 4,6-dehydratase [Deltaproteobacteria bacterium]|nr:GDP-mannose 4,6-dehydratase [Deltaproteobacteria bacterium]MBN2844776.1 GDP-mannose 4,6-dehydratase [Deltaproteobacteria bacterium]
MKKAFITGITGQDGSYLAEFLLEKGYEVHGLIRRSSSFNTDRIDHLYKDFHDPEARMYLHYGDLSVSAHLINLLSDIKPDEVYHLGAQSHVRVSFDMPEYTGDVTGLGTLRLLEAIRKTGIGARFYQASSSEMFGAAPPPQSEETKFEPQSPYAAAKVYSYYVIRNYRKAYNIYACNGILFNHESPRRGETFVTRKITRAATRIKLGLQDKLYLGNLEAKRDWGFAGDYVAAMWMMLQQDEPDDYVVATGETHSVREFAEKVFQKLDLDYKEYVDIDERYFRPTEVDILLGDSTKAREKLGWEPKVGFDELIDMMIDADMEHARKEKTLVDAGYKNVRNSIR